MLPRLRALVPVLAAIPVVVAVVVAAPARAAEPADADAVPPNAVVGVSIRKEGLSWLKQQLAADPAMRAELTAFLTRTVGVDLTAADGVTAWASDLDKPSGGAIVHLPSSGALTGRLLGKEGNVELHALGDAVAALVPSLGLIVGHDAEVRAAIRAARDRASRSPVASLFGRDADLQIVALASVLKDPQTAGAAQQFGVRSAILGFRSSGQIRLEVIGDGPRLEQLRTLIGSFANVALEKLRQDKEKQAQGNDVAAGLGAISSYYQMRRFWQELAPKLVGDRLVSVYQIPDVKPAMLLPMIGVMSAVALPAFLKYIRRSKTVEATMNVRRLAELAAAYAGEHKRKLPPSTDWTPARGCCGQPGDKCAPDPAAWSAPAWKAFSFAVPESHYYQYRFTRGQNGSYSVEARGDLDCDGKFSSYKRSGTVDGGTGALEVVDDLE